MSKDDLTVIAAKSNASFDDLEAILVVIDPPDSFTRVDLALVRLAAIQPWMTAFGYELLDEEEREILTRVVAHRPEWKNQIKPVALPRVDNRNLIAGRISKSPLYAAFVDMGDADGDTGEHVVYPILALFLIGCIESKICQIDPANVGLFVRKLFDQRDYWRIRLNECWKENNSDPNNIQALLECLSHHSGFVWAQRVISQLDLTVEPLISDHNNAHEGADSESGDKRPINQPIQTRKSRKDRIRIARIRQPRPDNDEFEPVGLSPEETGELVELLVAEPGEEFDLELQARKLARFTARDNQYLLWTNESLNPIEIGRIVPELNRLIESSPQLALIFGLVCCVARSPREVLSIRVFDHRSQLEGIQCEEIFLFRNDGAWEHPVFRPENAFEPDGIQQPYLVPTVDSVTLYLPDALARLCDTQISEHCCGEPLGQLLNVSTNNVEERMQEWVQALRSNTGISRVSIPKLRDWGMNYMLGTTQDPALLSQVFWVDSGISAQAYYATYQWTQLQQAYQTSLELLWGRGPTGRKESFDHHVGSKLLIKTEVVRQWVANWREKVGKAKKLRGIDRLIKEHNAVTAYCVMMMNFFTTHRDVNDPGESFRHFDFETQTGIICDKVVGGRDNGRLVCLGPMLVEQLQRYREHLIGLGSRMAAFESDLSSRILKAAEGTGNLPIFFFLEKTSNTQGVFPLPLQIRPKILAAELNLPVPTNWNRTFMRSHLVLHRVPVEFVNYQMGHVSAGQEFDGPFSVLSVEDLVVALTPAMMSIAELTGWKVIDGLRVYPSESHYVEGKQVIWKIGSKDRLKTRRQKSRQLYKKAFQCVEYGMSEGVSSGSIEAVLNRIETELPDHEKKRAQIIASKRIRKNHPGAAVLLDEIWPQNVELPVAKASKFNFNLLDSLRDGRRFRERLNEWIFRLSGEVTQREWVAICVASAVLYGGLVSDKDLKQFLHHSVYVFNDFIWAEMEDDYYKTAAAKRWFFDLCTAMLYLKGLEKHKNFEGVTFYEVERMIKRRFKIEKFNKLLSGAKALYRYQMPSNIASYICGEFHAASVSLDNWLRMLTGKRFKYEPPNDLSTYVRPKNEIDLTLRELSTYRNGKSCVRRIQSLIAQAVKSPNQMTRSELENELLKMRDDKILTYFSTLLLEFIIKILQDGRKKYHLAIGSIQTYSNQVLLHVYEASWNKNATAFLDSDELTEIYAEVLRYTADNNRVNKAWLLSDFHCFVMDKYNVPEVDFAELEPRSNLRTVRPALMTAAELEWMRNAMGRTVRVMQSLGTEFGLRGGEIRRLKPDHVWIEKNSGLISIFSRAGNKTKTINGIRQIPFQNRLEDRVRDDFKDFIGLLRDNKIGTFGGAIDDLQKNKWRDSVRDLTGDISLVPHSMRHDFVTKNTLKFTESTDIWPPGLADEDIQEGSDFRGEMRTFFFSSPQPTRRVLWQQTEITGHGSPEVSAESYLHHCDYVSAEHCNRAVVDNYELLSHLSGETYENLRQLKKRNPGAKFSRVLIRRAIGRTVHNPPERALEMISFPHFPETIFLKNPNSLRQVVEVIRLTRQGKIASVIGDILEIEEREVENWMQNYWRLEQRIGYRIQAQLVDRRSWLSVILSEPIRKLDRIICSDGPPVDERGILLTGFRDRYQPRTSAIYLQDETELEGWLIALNRIGIYKSSLSIVIPENHRAYEDLEYFGILSNYPVASVEKLNYRINARSCNAVKSAGLGLRIEGRSIVDKRFPLRDELNLLLAAAWCVQGF